MDLTKLTPLEDGEALQQLSLSKSLNHLPGHSRPDENRKRKASTAHFAGRIVRGPLKSLGLTQIVDSEDPLSHKLVVRDTESPWDTFQSICSCQLAGTVIVATRRSRPSQVKAIRKYSGKEADRVLQWFRIIRHPNILSAQECYRIEGALYAVVDDLPLTLEHLVSLCNIYPTEEQLSIIVKQILSGLSCLASASLEHNALICSNILLGIDGLVKISALESCRVRLPNQSPAPILKAIGVIVMRLMQKYEKNDGLLGIDNMDRWPLDSLSVGFLTSVESADSVKALEQHPLLTNRNRPPGDLAGLTRLILVASKVLHLSL
ncbi:hypothetical protein BDV12DRAFT_190663 [Aspergillus spectabilis]